MVQRRCAFPCTSIAATIQKIASRSHRRVQDLSPCSQHTTKVITLQDQGLATYHLLGPSLACKQLFFCCAINLGQRLKTRRTKRTRDVAVVRISCEVFGRVQKPPSIRQAKREHCICFEIATKVFGPTLDASQPSRRRCYSVERGCQLIVLLTSQHLFFSSCKFF